MGYKGTVIATSELKDKVIHRCYPNMIGIELEVLLEAQAEISFKAGREEEHKVMIGLAVDEGNKAFKDGKQIGIKEVVEWIHENSIGCISQRDIEEGRVRSGVGLSFISKDWEAQLKGWGAE